MDNEISYSDHLTKAQIKCMRHVLTYSPLIPDPKKGNSATSSVVVGPLDLPIVIVK